MSSRSNVTIAAITLSALISMTLSTSVRNASGRSSVTREADTNEGEALSAGRDDRRRHGRDPDCRRWPACRRSRHPDRVGFRRSRPDGDRRCRMSSASNSVIASQSRAAKCARSRSSIRLAAFSNRGAGGHSSSKRASAASRSASSKTSQPLIRSPSTVKTLIIRHSASKPSCEVPFTTWVTTAPRSLSRCTASTKVHASGVRSHAARADAARSIPSNDTSGRWSM